MELKMITWNIAESIPSAMAPPSWKNIQRGGTTTLNSHSTRAIRDVILSNDPDIIALQESPSPTWGRLTFGEDYDSVVDLDRPVSSHCGYVDLLVKKRKDLELSIESIDLHGLNLPSVAVTLRYSSELPSLRMEMERQNEEEEEEEGKDCSNATVTTTTTTTTSTTVTISSSHLAPFKGGANKRFNQIHTLHNAMTTPKEHQSDLIVLMGDMNMRPSEDQSIETSFNLEDAWKTMGSDGAKEHTWNTFVNRYHGWNSRKYTSRYDRVYFGKGNDDDDGKCRNGVWNVVEFDVIGNQPMTKDLGGGGVNHYLSDHFGLMTKFRFAPRNV